MIHLQSLNPSDTKQTDRLHSMIQLFYSEYETDNLMTATKVTLSIQHFSDHPETGRIVLIYSDDHIVGYAILVNFWSNEYGGIILFTDELFIIESYRNTGVGTAFFTLLEKEYTDIKVFALEVSPINTSASRLYKSLGFHANKNATLFKIAIR